MRHTKKRGRDEVSFFFIWVRTRGVCTTLVRACLFIVRGRELVVAGELYSSAGRRHNSSPFEQRETRNWDETNSAAPSGMSVEMLFSCFSLLFLDSYVCCMSSDITTLCESYIAVQLEILHTHPHSRFLSNRTSSSIIMSIGVIDHEIF